MIPIVREFFRGLRERDELEVIVPELLTAMGFEVLSRPMVGTRQYGADAAAIGVDDDGIRKLFLFSIKRGDLTRQEWNGSSDQSLRPSLDDILDVYLAGVAPAHAKLPVVICPTIGGVVLENALASINHYMAKNTKGQISFQLWTGDTLTRKVVDGALREEVFPAERRALLRKSAALVEAPETALYHFNRLVEDVVDDATLEPLARVRILYLALWIFTVWGRDAQNLEGPYRASEVVVLRSWGLLHEVIEKDKTRKQLASYALFELIGLHHRIWDELYGTKVLPFANQAHALSQAVPSREPIDINLALFETAGRIAIGGLWRLWTDTPVGSPLQYLAKPSDEVRRIAEGLAAMAANNPGLWAPSNEDQGIDLALCLMLLLSVPSTRHFANDWTRRTAQAIMIAVKVRNWFPITSSEYSDLIRVDGDDFEELTAASIIQPTLALSALVLSDAESLNELDKFKARALAHCNYQLWVPNARTESQIWRGSQRQGSSLGGLEIGTDGGKLLDAIRNEVAANVAYGANSAIRLDHWPILLLACRTVRVPPPPQFWLHLIDQIVTGPEPEMMMRVRRKHGGRSRYAMLLGQSTAMPGTV